MRLPKIGLGCMSLSHAYGVPPTPETGLAFLRATLDVGVGMLDTATLYGGGRNEELVGRALRGRRDEVVLASKCGMELLDGVKTIDGRPETLRRQIDASLTRLGVEHIDLYYLHRWDPKVPIGESVGALAEMVAAGKIGAIGLSEVSVARLREAPVGKDLLRRARQPMIESYDQALKSNSGWLSLVDRAQTERERIERYLKARQRLLALTPADVEAMARRYLDPAEALEVLVLPEGEDVAEE